MTRWTGAYRMEEGKGDGFYVIKAADGRTIDRDKLARAPGTRQ